MSEIRLNGPKVRPASGGPARQLVVFLHGVGADGDDLIGLAPYFAPVLPDAEFFAPHAPFACDLAPFGRQWFSLGNMEPDDLLAGVRTAAPILERFLDLELAARGLGDESLALVGFSQGTMMALHVALRRPRACASVVGYSGLLAGGEALQDELTVRPRVLLVHGESDDVVPYPNLGMARNRLERLGVPVVSLSCPGLAHSIDEQGLRAGIQFVAQGFGQAL